MQQLPGPPVDGGLGESAEHSHVWEASLVQDEQDGGADGNGQPNLHTSKHDAQPGSVEDNPVQLVDLQVQPGGSVSTRALDVMPLRTGAALQVLGRLGDGWTRFPSWNLLDTWGPTCLNTADTSGEA